MNVHFFLEPQDVAIVAATSKDAILEMLARQFAGSYDLNADDVLERLQEREALGSTGFGRGVAIPHARVTGVNRPVAVLLKLKDPVDFGAADGMPVDLVFGLISPEQSGAAHLHALAAISRLVRDERIHEVLSEAPDAEALYSLISNAADRDAA
ncbi:PTS transporter subunit EIIA [Altererythrobacter salegens]|uniref:PTS transporter subunit EIIA n=1 Tax=Croceibacterium salegens TaxID=1737568 RepID=A0A6I4T012_9SPHN|nr:PTS sugar transporter subunit IIA [Croceibacterium salegens]MXO60486.1 PTS transporter subunit EIIA [Croceibacterium salegens]